MFQTLNGWYYCNECLYNITPLGFLLFWALCVCYNHITPLGLVGLGFYKYNILCHLARPAFP